MSDTFQPTAEPSFTRTFIESLFDVGNNESDFRDRGDSADLQLAFPVRESASRGDIRQGDGADFDYRVAIGLPMADSFFENEHSLFLGDPQEFGDTEVSYLSNVGISAGEGGARLATATPPAQPVVPLLRAEPTRRDVLIDETWFEEGTVRQAFCYIRDHVRNLRLETPTLKGAALKHRADAMEFLYGEPTLLRVTLDECCYVIHESIRPDVLRLRVNYELFKRWVALPALMNDCVELPRVVLNKLWAADDMVAAAVAEQVWYQSGIHEDEAIRRSIANTPADQHAEIVAALGRLVANGVVGRTVGHLYLIGRNPQAEADDRLAQVPGTEHRSREESVSWSRLF